MGERKAPTGPPLGAVKPIPPPAPPPKRSASTVNRKLYELYQLGSDRIQACGDCRPTAEAERTKIEEKAGKMISDLTIEMGGEK